MRFPDRVRTTATVIGVNDDNVSVSFDAGFVFDVIDVTPTVGVFAAIVTVTDPGDVGRQVCFDSLFFDYEELGATGEVETVRGNVEPFT